MPLLRVALIRFNHVILFCKTSVKTRPLTKQQNIDSYSHRNQSYDVISHRQKSKQPVPTHSNQPATVEQNVSNYRGDYNQRFVVSLYQKPLTDR